ncbi:SRK2B [Symbiodinium pilosum]|uniref:SRK2B protein n=1 Tax=Symbiodinium pilosum TaxID=2952 RepID=A0A812X796_SYMPI|nr:SRK2B [Symbiodinium pilosum]
MAAPASLLQRRRNSGSRVLPVPLTCSSGASDTGLDPCHKLFEKYDLLERLGRGSSGQVLRARRKEDDKEVALKIMSATGPDVLASRRAEFEILQNLRHPNIVQGLEFLCSDTTAVVALSYHAGSTLYRAVRESAGGCLEEVASQHLTDLHLVDFNTARPLMEGGSLTMTGTLEYAAPEVLHGESPSEQHDVWGAGLCLHWMLMGSLPHRPSGYPNVEAFAEAVLSEPVTCQEGRWQVISKDCRTVVRQCLALKKHQRPAALLLLAQPWLQDLPCMCSLPDLPQCARRTQTEPAFVLAV